MAATHNYGYFRKSNNKIILSTPDTFKFIQLFKEEENLWNTNDYRHNNKILRSQSLQEIARKMNNNWTGKNMISEITFDRCSASVSTSYRQAFKLLLMQGILTHSGTSCKHAVLVNQQNLGGQGKIRSQGHLSTLKKNSLLQQFIHGSILSRGIARHFLLLDALTMT